MTSQMDVEAIASIDDEGRFWMRRARQGRDPNGRVAREQGRRLRVVEIAASL